MARRPAFPAHWAWTEEPALIPRFRTAPRPDPTPAPESARSRPTSPVARAARVDRGARRAWWWAAIVLLAAWLSPAFAAVPAAPAGVAAAEVAADGAANAAAPQMRLALAQAPADVPLEEILSGRARIGFTPLVARGAAARAEPGSVLWLRVRLDGLPGDDAQALVLPRQAIRQLRLYAPGPPARAIAEDGLSAQDASARWPGRFVLPMPAGEATRTLYLRVDGQGWLNLQPALLDGAHVARQRIVSERVFDALYGSFLALGLLALLRRGLGAARTLRVAAAAFACLAATLVGNQHLQLSVGGANLASLPALAAALWVVAAATLLWATTQYAGLEKNYGEVATALDRAGVALVGIAVLLVLAPARWLPAAQLFALGTLGATALAGAGALMFDHRHWRWVAALLWLVFLAALAAPVLASMQLLEDTLWVRRGFQLVLALQLANYLLLPWGRQAWLRWRETREARAPELSAEEKIAQARDWMISSLQSGIQTGADGDMEWIAYRRLMGGLKSVLPQTAAAVIAMNYHNEDLMLAEPKSAEPRFQMLLAQRASMLKNLSRSMGPQQFGLDFNGPDGPLQQVQLAVIPLPIERPGWGALLIERSPNVSYSDEELDLCTEFAALATTAGDEAAEAMQKRRAQEIDDESGVYRAAMVESLLQKAHALALQKRRPLSVMRIAIDGYADLPPELGAESVRVVADVVRDEIEYGESIGRAAADGFIVLLPGRPIGDARALGERLCAAMRKLALPVAEDRDLGVSIGVAQMHSGEKLTRPMLDRAERALGKARQYGGNQVQAIASVAK
jgi:diguanylate cyclase (GGDEF)-like protein